jgi:L-arabinose isomerase
MIDCFTGSEFEMKSDDSKNQKQPSDHSFMISKTGDSQTYGDLLSADLIDGDKEPRVGLLATGFFEFWPMYPNLLKLVKRDAKIVYERLSKNHNIVYSGLVDTMDKADKAGRLFRDEKIDLLIMEYRTYIPDVYIHHLLSFLDRIPLLFFASQSRDRLDPNDNYCGAFRNSGIMAEVQLVAGFRKMGIYKNRLEVVVGSIYDDEAYKKINRYIEVVSIYKRLRRMTIGVIGHVFRGMFDFEYDRTKVKGGLGPEVITIHIDHLLDEFDRATLDDKDVIELIRFAREEYIIEGIGDSDLERTARAAIALKRLVDRFRLDGVAILGQHYVEKRLKTTPFLGLNELHRIGRCPGVSEGDVIGVIMMKIMQYLSGNMAFHLEYSEFDIEHNAWMLLGHGFGDPNQARGDTVRLTPAPEHWGHEGTGVSTLFVLKPGPCTLAHLIEDAEGWRMFISKGEILDMPPLPINEVHAVVRVERPIKEYSELIVKAGVPHHAITVRGDISRELEQLADLMEMKVMIL